MGRVLVVHLCTNWGGGDYRAAADRLLGSLVGVERVVWVTCTPWLPAVADADAVIRSLPGLAPGGRGGRLGCGVGHAGLHLLRRSAPDAGRGRRAGPGDRGRRRAAAGLTRTVALRRLPAMEAWHAVRRVAGQDLRRRLGLEGQQVEDGPEVEDRGLGRLGHRRGGGGRQRHRRRRGGRGGDGRGRGGRCRGRAGRVVGGAVVGGAVTGGAVVGGAVTGGRVVGGVVVVGGAVVGGAVTGGRVVGGFGAPGVVIDRPVVDGRRHVGHQEARGHGAEDVGELRRRVGDLLGGGLLGRRRRLGVGGGGLRR